MIEYKN